MPQSSGFKKYFSNTAWMVGGRLFKSVIAFVVSVFVARYLGPDRFGVLYYAIGIAMLFAFFCAMGQDSILIRELVGEKEKETLLLGSSVLIRAGGIVIAFICTGALLLLTKADQETWVLTLICSCSYIFRGADVLRNFFEATVQAKTIVIVETLQCLISSALRIYFIAVQGSVVWFAVCWLSEWVFIAIGFVIFYHRKQGSFGSWRYDLPTLKHLVRESMPLLLSAMAVVVYQQVDKIMLKNMLGAAGNQQVGLYSAAIRIMPFAILIPQLMSKALSPSLIASKKSKSLNYEQRNQLFNDLIIWVGIGLSLILFLLAGMFMDLFGAEYKESVGILRIIAWKGLLVAMSVASAQWIIIEGKQKGVAMRNLAGCVVNILLNYLWIPKWGAIGSAWATILSFATASFLIHAFIPSYRPIFYIQIKSLATGWMRLGQALKKGIRQQF